MKSLPLAALLLVSSCASASADVSGSTLAIHGGVRSFEGGEWENVDDQGVLGLEFVLEQPGSSIGLELGVFASSHEEDATGTLGSSANDRGRTGEVAFGVHKTFRTDYEGVHPYLGGGISLLHAELRRESGGSEDEDEDGSGGLYLHGGVEFDASSVLFFGLDLRLRAGTDVDLFGSDTNADYGQVALVLGFRL